MQLALFSTTKICPKCGIEKSVSEYSKLSSSKDGLQRKCRQCASIDNKKYCADNPDKESERKRLYNAANPEKAKERYQRYYASNPEKAKERVRRWSADNPEKRREKDRRYYATNPEKKKEKARAWQAANRDKENERHRRYNKANKEILSIQRNRRRARKHNAEGNCDVIKLNNRKSMYGNQCYLCGNEATAIDHVKPLAKGGSNWPSNLRPICGKCNSSKHAKWPYELPHIPLTRFSEFSQKFN